MGNEQITNVKYPNVKCHFSSRDFGFICDSAEDEYTCRPSVYVVVFDNDQNIATLEFRKGVKNIFCLPGGGVEDGEDFIQDIVREAKEEIGCNLKNIEQLGSFESFCNKSKRRFENIIFRADLDGEKGEPMPAEDYEQGLVVVWKTMSDLKQQLEEISMADKDKIEFRSLFVLKMLSLML